MKLSYQRCSVCGKMGYYHSKCIEILAKHGEIKCVI